MSKQTRKILTFKPYHGKRTGGRYCKVINGKTLFFGTTPDRGDKAAYKAAELAYFRYRVTGEMPKSQNTVTSSGSSVEDIANEFIDALYERFRIDDLSGSYFSKARHLLVYFLNYIKRDTDINSISARQLEKFRVFIFGLPKNNHKRKKYSGRISIATAHDILSMTKAFLRWAWRYEYIESLPRNINSLCKYSGKIVRPNPKIYTLEDLKILWENSDSRLRCFSLLALNCGMGAKDISDLLISEVDWDAGYIDRERSKTEVRGRYKLWDTTLQLMRKNRHNYRRDTDGSERVFLTTVGKRQPLVRTIDDGGKIYRVDAIANLFYRCRKKSNIKPGRSFYNLRKTGATMVDEIDPMVTGLYLSHAERTMKRHYVQEGWTRLDKALMGVQEKLGDIICCDKDCCT